ncbi:DNA polymerase bacteriophage-type [Tribonema minus]|uniref:Type-4 uracil-DNA glycosylase n=1 Tax=Tribonema minus TaxID=303371 RepID=A0A835YMS9_9STRA|nr:DNA polymerase bacteriophage-type [Tribonema minus]
MTAVLLRTAASAHMGRMMQLNMPHGIIARLGPCTSRLHMAAGAKGASAAVQQKIPQFKDHAEMTAALLALTGDPLEPAGGRIVVYRGDPQAKLMVVGEAPGAMEDETGKPFVGRSGQLLDAILKAAGFDPETDLYVSNIVRRRPPENRDPTTAEIAYYRPWLLEEIRLVNPAIIITTGRWSMRAVLNERRGITKVRGQWYAPGTTPDLPAATWAMPWFHPSYLLRNPTKDEGGPKWLTWVDAQEVRRKYDELLGASFLAVDDSAS